MASPEYKRLVAGLLLFALINSSDVFLLLKAREITGSDTLTIGAYVGYNLLYALLSYPAGALADRYGLKTVFAAGLLLFALVYLLFAVASSALVVFVGFALYALYAAATEGVAKAWISNLTQGQHRATALGFYTSGQSICSLVASTVAGFLWSHFNSVAAFGFSAAVAVAVCIYFQAAVGRRSPARRHGGNLAR